MGQEQVKPVAQANGASNLSTKSVNQIFRHWGRAPTNPEQQKNVIELHNRITRQLPSANLVRAMVITDVSDVPSILFVHDLFEKLTLYTREEIIGKPWSILFQNQLLPSLRDVRQGEPAQLCVVNFRKGGVPFWNAMEIRPIKADGGAITHFVMIHKDTTQLRLNPSPQSWSKYEVAMWLTLVDPSWTKYATNFLDHEVDGTTLLELHLHDFDEIGVATDDAANILSDIKRMAPTESPLVLSISAADLKAANQASLPHKRQDRTESLDLSNSSLSVSSSASQDSGGSQISKTSSISNAQASQSVPLISISHSAEQGSMGLAVSRSDHRMSLAPKKKKTDSPITLKCIFSNQTKELEVTKSQSFEKTKKKIEKMYGFYCDIRAQDSEGDLIRIMDDASYETVLSLLNSSTLIVFVSKVKQQVPAKKTAFFSHCILAC